VLEQYRLYVEMTDKISERRQSANTYLLTVNTVLVTILGLSNAIPGRTTNLVFLAAAGIAGLALSFTWYRLIASYRQLNTGKFRVVHAIERLLPLRPFDAEWTAIGRGENPNLYRPFTSVETWIPGLFFLLYLGLLSLSVIASLPWSCSLVA
jgi:hypothetical protein